MNTNTISGLSAGRRWSAVRDDLRETRQAREARRAVKRDLASYKTPSELNDLLGSLSGQDGPELEVIRDILIRNLQQEGQRQSAA